MKSKNTVSNIDNESRNLASIRLAQSLWNRGTPITGTPAESYLVSTRKIPASVVSRLQFKYVQGKLGIPKLDQYGFDDYLIAPVFNLKDELIGLQIVQLDAKGNKALPADADKSYYCKMYLGPVKPALPGKAAVINDIENQDAVFIAEGIETAASIAAIPSIREQYSILASLGVTELPATLSYIRTHYSRDTTIILLKDHDQPGSSASNDFQKALKLFEGAGYHVIVKEPVQIDNDWNDVLAQHGSVELERQLAVDVDALQSQGQAIIRNELKNLYASLLTSEAKTDEQNLLFSLSSVINHKIDRMTAIIPFIENSIKRLAESDQLALDAETAYFEKNDAELRLAMKALDSIRKRVEPVLQLPPLPEAVEEYGDQCLKLETSKKNLPGNNQRALREEITAAYEKAMKDYVSLSTTPGAELKKIAADDHYAFFFNLSIERSKTQSFSEMRRSLSLEIKNREQAQRDQPEKARAEKEQEYKHELLNASIKQNELAIELVSYMNKLSVLIDSSRLSVEREIEDIDYRAYQDFYVKLHEEAQASDEDLESLQHWLNNLGNFKTLSPLKYEPPKGEDVRPVKFIFEEYDEQETLENITDAMMNHLPPATPALDPHDKGKEIDDQEAAPQQDDLLTRSIYDYVIELSAILYKSFEVNSPDGKFTQEFDGLVVRDRQLTIMERKANDGTGVSVLQRNFCQQKIGSKEQFVDKNWLPSILGHAQPESFIKIDAPESKDWYSPAFDDAMKNRLMTAAKKTIVEALREFRLEFNMNLPKHFSDGYQGVFFSSRLNDVKVRFSRQGLGNETIAHRRIDDIKSDMATEVMKRV
ncbi:toprim domain-containing protein [Legionella genomosp. 1]|uniref:toprim domain-containing protein n=1 Tax=Legionella genomosp. 1 TaxID=1093625 RepID=UPI0010542D53|nr:toprim domain-containing protein [Legionella genomosp. 1]